MEASAGAIYTSHLACTGEEDNLYISLMHLQALFTMHASSCCRKVEAALASAACPARLEALLKESESIVAQLRLVIRNQQLSGVLQSFVVSAVASQISNKSIITRLQRCWAHLKSRVCDVHDLSTIAHQPQPTDKLLHCQHNQCLAVGLLQGRQSMATSISRRSSAGAVNACSLCVLLRPMHTHAGSGCRQDQAQ